MSLDFQLSENPFSGVLHVLFFKSIVSLFSRKAYEAVDWDRSADPPECLTPWAGLSIPEDLEDWMGWGSGVRGG